MLTIIKSLLKYINIKTKSNSFSALKAQNTAKIVWLKEELKS